MPAICRSVGLPSCPSACTSVTYRWLPPPVAATRIPAKASTFIAEATASCTAVWPQGLQPHFSDSDLSALGACLAQQARPQHSRSTLRGVFLPAWPEHMHQIYWQIMPDQHFCTTALQLCICALASGNSSLLSLQQSNPIDRGREKICSLCKPQLPTSQSWLLIGTAMYTFVTAQHPSTTLCLATEGTLPLETQAPCSCQYKNCVPGTCAFNTVSTPSTV
jgi:hypothetical protein